MKTTDSMKLLLAHGNLSLETERDQVESEAIAIVEELGCLPLAIEQAAARIRMANNPRSIFQFREEYRRHRQLFLDLDGFEKAGRVNQVETAAQQAVRQIHVSVERTGLIASGG